MTKKHIPVVGSAIALVVATGGLYAGASHADAGSRAPGVLAPASRVAAAPARTQLACTTVKVASNTTATLVSASSASVRGAARVVTFANGTRQVLPPTGWTPTKATAAELTAYGFEARPTDAAGKAQWATKYANWTPTGIDAPCVSNATAGLKASSSANWSGVIDHCATGNCTRASGVWFQPNLSKETCSASSTHTIWAGLGGVSDQGLIQGGVDHTGHAWWEVIAGGHDTHVTYFSSHSYPVGHKIQADALYYPATRTALIQVLDTTTGFMEKWSGTTAPDNNNGGKGFAVSGAWTGTSAEYIDERLTVNGGLTAYRQSASGKTNWWNALTDTRGHRLNPSEATFVPEASAMTNGSHTLGTVQMLSGSSWNDYTKACS